MGRKRSTGWRWQLAAALLLVAAGAAIWAWWQAQHWTPSREDYPVQGVLLGERDGGVDFRALEAIGANFVYIEGSKGASARDRAFSGNLAALQGGALPFGVVHEYDPCVPAERQAGNFVTMVPRDANMLPPVIALDKLASECGDPAIEQGLEAELTTFINQVEGHAGQPVILRISERFEAEHGVAARIERNLWLERSYLEPEYGGRPFTLWTANPALATEVTDEPVRWVVAQP